MSAENATVGGGLAAASSLRKRETLLEVKGLKKYFPVTEGIAFHKTVAEVKAVDGVSFHISKGETLGLVGESGCGKTTTGRCILQLDRPTAGEILFEGVNLAELNTRALRPFRQKIQVIFQDPYSSLNPRMKTGDIVAEPISVYGLEPDQRRFMLVWRASTPLRKNIFDMASVVVGRMPKGWYRARRLGKTYYTNLKELVDEYRELHA